MQPELYFFEEWLRTRHAELRAAARSAALMQSPDCGTRGHLSRTQEADMVSMKHDDFVANWKDIAASFLKLGATSYGGPA